MNHGMFILKNSIKKTIFFTGVLVNSNLKFASRSKYKKL